MTREQVLSLAKKLQGTWTARNSEYDIARRRYAGEHWGDETNPTPQNRYSLTINYLKPFVDKSVQMLVGRMPAIQVMPPGVDEDSRRQAEQEEGILYGTWDKNDAPSAFQKTAWDSFVLRRGLIYVWWDPDKSVVRFKNCSPENFLPEYDGDSVYRAIYVSRRLTAALKEQYPEHASKIYDDQGMDFVISGTADGNRVSADGQTTVVDCFTADGHFYRVMGDAFISHTLNLPWDGIPFVEFPCFPLSGESEPLNLIDQLIELNQYLDVLVSQQADIIARYANPVVIDEASGQPPEFIRKAMGAPGAVLPIKKGGDVRLLNWTGSIPAISEQMTFVVDSLFDLAGKPRSAFGQQDSQQSGVQTNLALTPTLQSNEFHESIWGRQLSKLNEMILMLWEKNMSGEVIDMRGRYSSQSGSQKFYDVEITGEDIGGWYKNRIKWPSAIRTDDPVYVQNLLSQLTSDPPAISLYTYEEEMGREDVEAEIDRIQQQLEDPRIHPERLKSAIDAASAIGQNDLGGGGFGGFAPSGGLPPDVATGAPADGGFAGALQGAGVPDLGGAVAAKAPPSGY